MELIIYEYVDINSHSSIKMCQLYAKKIKESRGK